MQHSILSHMHLVVLNKAEDPWYISHVISKHSIHSFDGLKKKHQCFSRNRLKLDEPLCFIQPPVFFLASVTGWSCFRSAPLNFSSSTSTYVIDWTLFYYVLNKVFQCSLVVQFIHSSHLMLSCSPDTVCWLLIGSNTVTLQGPFVTTIPWYNRPSLRCFCCLLRLHI